ncbi:PaaI family thioesterase [Pelagibius litoralis]|uniref:Medium/long-chain acyl-CoA thioesterase YigI n=2 Tax=Pelagibius litoralis TaxID=374515 RepID=A0A967F354_9PROT|nr:PaaI family thioesterase [Pelagibius litoralis]
MPEFKPRDAGFAARVRDSFGRQSIMDLMGARLTRVDPGEVEIELPFRPDLCQQHGFFHAGVTSTIADSAGGYAGFSLFPADASVLTVEFKMNLLAPADGDLLRAVGRVIKPGRTLTVTEAEVIVVKDGKAKACAHMLQTLMCLQGRADMPAAG